MRLITQDLARYFRSKKKGSHMKYLPQIGILVITGLIFLGTIRVGR